MSKKNHIQYNNQQANSNYEDNTTMASNGLKSTSVEDTRSSADTVTEVKIPTVQTPTVQASTVVTPKQEVKKEVVNTNVDKLNKLLSEYEQAVTHQQLSANEKFESITVMISLCDYINRTNDPAVFEAFFRYFQRHQNDNMHFETALRGIHTIQNKNVKTRVSSTHAVFVELARVRSLKKATFQFTINSMKLMNVGESLGKWVIAKSQTRQ